MAGPVYIADPESAVRTRRARRPVGALPRAFGHDPYRRRRRRRRSSRRCAPGPPTPPNCSRRLRAHYDFEGDEADGGDPRPPRRARGRRPGAPRMRHRLDISDRPGRLPHRLGLAGAARRARAPLRRLSRARGRALPISPSGSSRNSPGGAGLRPSVAIQRRLYPARRRAAVARPRPARRRDGHEPANGARAETLSAAPRRDASRRTAAR